MGLRERVLEKLAENPMPFDALFDCIQDVENSKQLANALYTLKLDKRVVLGEDKIYRLADNSKRVVSLMPAKQNHKSGAETSTPALNSPNPKTNVKITNLERQLEQLATQAQAALDDYLYDIGDRCILDPLVASRNGARDALTAYRSKINSENLE